MMKKLLCLLVALPMAIISFADVRYELNGGWTNDDGWQNKQDMYAGLNSLWNTFAKVPTNYVHYTRASLDSCAGDVAKGIPAACYEYGNAFSSFFADAATKAKFQWLADYMQYVCTLQKVEAGLLADGNAAFLRYNLQAFFLNTQRTAWPVSANYESYGNIEYFQSYWKHGFANPTHVDGEYILQAPYKETTDATTGATIRWTFDGWYTNAAFLGERVVKIDAGTTGTLYAKWVEYIPTIAEVIAMDNGAVSKIQATTTYFDGTKAYLQDATGGMRVVFPRGTTLAENTKYLVKGTKSVVNGAPTLTVTEVIAQEAASPVVPIVVDQVRFLPDYVGMLIKLEGKRIAGYSANGDPLFRDDYNTIASYELPIEQITFYRDRKTDVVGVVESWGGELRIRAFMKNVTPSAPAGRDEHQYEAIPTGTKQDGKSLNYYLSNDWMYSNVLGNFASNKPNDIASGSRAVVLHNGFLYFPNRDANQPTYFNFKKVNIANGDMFDAIPAADYLFRARGTAGRDFVFGPANDLKTDNAGHILAANLITSAKGEFQVWVMDDIDNGKGHLLIDETTLMDDYADNTTIRFDAFGVYGDVTKEAVVMAASGSTTDVYYWNIRNGKWDGNHQYIPTKGNHNFGMAPQIFPIGDDMFYGTVSTTILSYPILFDMKGNDVDWFDATQEGGMAPLVTNRNGQIRKTGHNGLAEFELGGEYFLVMAGGNTDNNPASTFVLYKFADEYREFGAMTQMWEFPYDGMGDTSNDVRVAVPYVQVVDDHTAKICVYTNNNGYGVYTFSVATSDPSRPGTLSVRSANATMGSATGSGSYAKGETVSISATANHGYHFVQWQDGNTDNPRSVEITEDEASYIAIFAKNIYNITTYATNGSITGKTSGAYLDDIVVTAVPDEGYHFTQWGDGSTTNPRTITLTQDTTIVALFAANRYTVTTAANVSAWGSTDGDAVVAYRDWVTISATANYGYHFVRWNDGNTDNPRSVQVLGDVTYTATFGKNTYSITTYATNGSVEGNKSGAYLDDIVVTAVPDEGYHFTQWGDGNTDNPRTILLTRDTTLIALFAANRYTVTTGANVSEWGTTDGDAVVAYRDWVTISATANYGYHFEQWSDGNTDNPRLVQVTEDADYIANFAKNYYFVYAGAENGTVIGGGSGRYLDEMTLTVVPNTGYYFVQWNDGNTDNPRTVLLTQDMTMTALCMQASSGKCGDNLYWNYSDGTLRITGYGAMYDFTDSSMPWVSYCSAILSVTFAAGMTHVGDYAFYGCGSLTSVEMPNSVTTIGASAFAMCASLGKVVIGSGTNQIGDKAFSGCRKLFDVYCYAVNPPVAESSSFVNYNAHLYIPCDSKEDYEVDMVFGSFKFIECIDEIGTGEAVVTAEEDMPVRKVFRDGQVYILRNGKTYTITGVEVE